MHDHDGTRRFSEREVSLVLETAARLQARDGDAVDTAGGGRLSQAELERIGAEVGMDAALIRRAVHEVDARRARSGHSRLLGGPGEIVVERVVAGEAGAAAAEAALQVVRRVTGELGDVSSVGRLFGWRGALDDAKAEVSLATADGRTTVRVRVALEEVASRKYGSVALGMGGGSGFLLVAVTINVLGPAAWLLAGSAAGVGYLAARRQFAALAERYGARAHALADAIVDALAAARPSADAAAPLPPPAGRQLPG